MWWWGDCWRQPVGGASATTIPAHLTGPDAGRASAGWHTATTGTGVKVPDRRDRLGDHPPRPHGASPTPLDDAHPTRGAAHAGARSRSLRPRPHTTSVTCSAVPVHHPASLRTRRAVWGMPGETWSAPARRPHHDTRPARRLSRHPAPTADQSRPHNARSTASPSPPARIRASSPGGGCARASGGCGTARRRGSPRGRARRTNSASVHVNRPLASATTSSPGRVRPKRVRPSTRADSGSSSRTPVE